MVRRFSQVDVFTTEPYRGNPVAVVHDAAGIDDEEMLRIANWTNLSETTYLLAPSSPAADYRLRTFTPVEAALSSRAEDRRFQPEGTHVAGIAVAYDGRVLYQPGHRKFEVEDPAALLEELCRHVPGTLVTHTAEGFRASILPMLFDPEDGPFGTLRGHLARGNPHWRDVGHETDGLAIFDGPDAYVSPAWYAEKRVTGKVVPTWNYTTVQAQGLLTVRHEPEWLLAHVRRLVDRHEQQRPDPWSIDDAPDGYVETQVRAIVGLELRIDRLEAKRKLSQNRSDADIAGTIAGLSSGGPGEQAVAASMLEQTKG